MGPVAVLDETHTVLRAISALLLQQAYPRRPGQDFLDALGVSSTVQGARSAAVQGMEGTYRREGIRTRCWSPQYLERLWPNRRKPGGSFTDNATLALAIKRTHPHRPSRILPVACTNASTNTRPDQLAEPQRARRNTR